MTSKQFTHIEHAVFAAGIQSIMAFCCFHAAYLSWVTLLLTAFPGLFLFYGREHAQYSNALKTRYNSPVITWRITYEALFLWRCDDDGDTWWDFLLPVLVTIPWTLLLGWVYL